jgi:hypothetical protein
MKKLKMDFLADFKRYERFKFKACPSICLYLRFKRLVVDELDVKRGQEGDFNQKS